MLQLEPVCGRADPAAVAQSGAAACRPAVLQAAQDADDEHHDEEHHDDDGEILANAALVVADLGAALPFLGIAGENGQDRVDAALDAAG